MKKIVLITLLITTHTYAQVGKVPAFWTSSEVEQNSFLSPDTFDENSELSAAYENILDTNSDLFKTVEIKPNSRWYLQSIKTELAVEAEGTLGVMGVGGEAALELVWNKKRGDSGAQPLQPVKLDEEVNGEAEDVVISTDMSPEILKEEISPVVELAMASGHVKKRQRLFRNLFEEALKFQNTARELESSPVMGPWYAYKYQLELFVSAEGDIGQVEVGNSLRLRLEWYRLQKKNPVVFTPPLKAEELSPNAKFVAAIASDVAAADRTPYENGFRLNCLKVGVGTTVEGNLFFVKGKASAVGSIFFKRDEEKNQGLELPFLMNEVENYALIQKGTTALIPRYSFRKGIEKAASISHFFAKHARTREEDHFELDVIETEFELYGNGGLGIVTVEGSSGLTLFVTRNVTI